MKKVPELRFPGFKEEWKEQKFNKCFKIIDGDRGKNYPKSEELSDDGFCLFLSAKNVTKDGFMFDEKAFISKEKDLKLGNGKLERKDIVITTRGTIGNISVFSENIYYDNIRINSGMIILRSLNSNELFNYQFLKSPNFIKTVKRITFGSAQPQLTKGDISKLRISEPSLDEQEKIADFFSTLDSRIEIQEEKINNLEDQKKGYMQRIFSQEIRFKDENGEDYPEWEEKRLGEIAKCHDSKRIPISATKREQIVGQYPYYGANGIQGYINDYIFEGEFVLLAEDGGNFDDFATRPIAQFVSGKFWVNNHAHILSTMNNTKFMYYSLVHKDIRAYVNGTSRSKLNQFDMLQIKILQPSLKEQQKIADFLSLFDEKIEIERKILETLQEMKRGFLQKMFV